MILFRSMLYQAGMAVLTFFFLIFAILILPFPGLVRSRWMANYARWCLAWLEITCGLRFKVEGLEKIPGTPSVILCKHQSAWETLALQLIFPPQAWVLKRELLWIPFFGWGLATLSPIAIDRSQKKKAMQQMIDQGRVRAKQGFWMVIFPEGTRIAAGKRGKYKQGGARLASDLNLPIVPVAHNAGEFWPRNGFRKYPGVVTMVIGDPILPAEQSSEVLTQQVEDWIEARVDEISGVGPCHPKNLAKLR